MDRLDHQILHALGINGRVSFRRLAVALGATEHTVARRYRALAERGVVRVVAMPTPHEGDMGQMLRLHVHPGSAARLADALVRRDDVSWVRTAGAGSEIMCGVRAASAEQRDHLILDQLPRTGRVTRVVAYELLHHHRTPGHADWEGFPDPLTERQRELVGPLPMPESAPRLAAQDWVLLDALRHDARRSAADLAAETNQPESTVRRRLDILLRSGAIYLDRDLDPVPLGFPVGATLHIDVEPRHLRAAGAALARHAPTTFVAAVTGPVNLFAAVVTATIRDLYEYVSTTLADLDGVTHIETSLTGTYLKHARVIRRPR
ncbi:Lrp/AsnC family transcriptional regulator [Streptosporangium saharense]|uniref:DNA-binding Lrp family transcriptional regulator n=1 Tax=Streptosporangium saharense TaxID=1706840 RepID=A0A7W7QV42_9ACTN|nr:Lrp/AsnC family transcriptional regulator [Streptosporangium saharense]MBB4920327.1 DNA-binding Lrp family transcriptional regulator [Streptosporangium saharense]